MNKILKNIGWLIFDKIFILVLQFLVGVKIANHYGSMEYGKYSYAMSIIAFSPMLIEIINTRVVKTYFYKYKFNIIVSAVSTFKNMISILVMIIVIFSKIFFQMDNELYLLLIFLSLDNIFISSTIGVENYFEYKINSKYIVISNNIVKLISYFIQYMGIILDFNIIFIPIARCIGSFIRTFILRYQYKKVYSCKERIIFNKKIIFKLIKESYFLWLSFISFILSTNIDKIMLGKMMKIENVGIYSIGMQLGSVLMILVNPFQTTIFSELLNLFKTNKEKYFKRYIFYTKLLTNIYLIIIPLSFIVLKYSFLYVFSEEYIKAVNVYMILCFGILIKANVFLRSSHLTLTNMTNLILKSEVLAAFSNIILNYILIKKYGIYGAAIATSITQIISLWVVDSFSKEGRKLLINHLKGFWIFSIKKYK